MSIDNVSHASNQRLVTPGAFRKADLNKNANSSAQSQQNRTAPQNAEPAAAPENTASEADHAKGVLRLLEEGHFKGVADVRLRINFFDELYAGAAETSHQNTQQSADELVNTVNEQVNTLLGSLELDEQQTLAVTDLRAVFETEVDNALGAYLESESPDKDALAGAIQSSFDHFIEQLRLILTPPAPPEESTETAETNQPTDTTETPTDTASTDPTFPLEEPPLDTDLPDTTVPSDTATTEEPSEPESASLPEEDPLAALIAAFEESLTNLLDTTDVNALLPDPSPPTGNGAAYDKFLAIYNELRGITSIEEESTTSPESIDEIG